MREEERRGQYKDPSLKLLLWVPQSLNPWESPTKTTHASQGCPSKCWETEKFIQGSQSQWLMVSPGALASSSFRPHYWYLGEEVWQQKSTWAGRPQTCSCWPEVNLSLHRTVYCTCAWNQRGATDMWHDTAESSVTVTQFLSCWTWKWAQIMELHHPCL